MLRIYLTLLLLLPLSLAAKVLPAEGSVLSYRIAGFTWPGDGATYRLEIAEGNYTTEREFARHIGIRLKGTNGRLIAEVPYFGRQYTWRAVCVGKTIKGNYALHHFSVAMSRAVDTAANRLRISQPAAAYSDSYVSTEASGAIYDMEGKPVWCMPEQKGPGANVMDMQVTAQGTMTCLADQHGYEVNYNGDVLWQTPATDTANGSSSEDIYHHELTRLGNGHYMVLGSQFLLRKALFPTDSTFDPGAKSRGLQTAERRRLAKVKNGVPEDLARFGTLVELDEKGNVVWCWRSSKYLLVADYAYFNPAQPIQKFDPHDNAFFFDEQNSVIYMGFRNMSRIVKIAYPSGKVLATYGEQFKKGIAPQGNGIFCNQHSIGRSHDGYLYIFNNNSCQEQAQAPSVLMMQEPANADEPLKKVWEYVCPVEGNYPSGFPSGGNAKELADGSMFICMGSNYGKLLIVNRDKQILWSALPEQYNSEQKKWEVPKTYRANIISREELEKMIWKGEEEQNAMAGK